MRRFGLGILTSLLIVIVVSTYPGRPVPLASFGINGAGASITATAMPTATVPQHKAQALFPIGVFEDGNIIGGNATKFEAMLKDLKAHGIDTVLFVNNTARRDEPLLTVADKYAFNIFMMPNGDLNDTWWADDIPADIITARGLAKPIVALWSKHSSFKGYLIRDEPSLGERQKVALMTQAFREADPTRPVLMTLIGLNRVGPIFAAAKPDVMQIDVYPIAADNPSCDFTMNGFGYPQHDFVSYTRAATATKPSGTPLWIILQTHGFDVTGAALRTPLPTEVRMQQWLALGEGATGIYWFVYSTQQSWIGLADNKPLYNEVSALARRVGPLRNILLGLHRIDTRFTVTGNNAPYVSTLTDASGSNSYAVVVNKDCQKAQNLVIQSSIAGGHLRDLESGTIYALGQPIAFQPGDGRIFAMSK